MTFLPIVERELRVAARRPGTYWTRWFAALGMLATWVVLGVAIRRAQPAEVSKTLFLALGIMALGFSLLAGIFLTADCLSEEKREGTLGLLFLTDLRGYDVVLGKLIATSVHSMYGLLAIFPVLALPLMMGGVTGGEFWRMVLVLAVTLFLSLSMGMVVSAAVRESRRAMAGTFLGMLLLAGLPWAVWSLGEVLFGTWKPTLLLSPSPIKTFIYALDSYYRVGRGAVEFWGSLQTVLALGLGCLILAAILLPRACQEQAGSPPDTRGAGRPGARGSARDVSHVARPRALLETNPYLWLASRTRPADVFTTIIFGLVLLLWFCSLAASVVGIGGRRSGEEAFVICLFSAYALHQVAKYHVAVEATRQLGEDRQSGALELLLITPLGEARVLSGQERALELRSRSVKLLLVLVNLCMCLAVLTRSERLHMNAETQAIFVGLFVGGMLALFADCRALQTVGMWTALRARKQQRAVLGSLGRVMLVPWAGILLWVFATVTGAFNPSEGAFAVVLTLWFAAGILNDLVVSAQARARLGQGLRYWLSRTQAAGGREPFPALVHSVPKALYA